MSTDKKVCLGVVVGAHGVRGQVRIKCFTEEPEGIAAYGPVETRDGSRHLEIAFRGVAKGLALCAIEGVTDRDTAEALRGTELYVPRERLPETDEDEEGWYYVDLIGLAVVGLDGTAYGKVAAVQNYGAGDLLEIAPAEGGATVLMPFTEDNAQEVDIEGGKIVIDPPMGTFGEDEGGEEEAEEAADD